MSQLSYMEKLLDGVKVESKALEDVVKIKRGKRLVKSQLEKSGNYAVYQNSMTPLGYYHESNVKSDTTFIISAGAAGEIGYSDVDFWAADDVYFLSTPNNIESKFLYHFLLLQQYKILAQVRRASIPRLSRTAIEKLQIPIPPLNIQAEIVRILDAFTELTAELTAELVARKQQYAYYRKQLLTLDNGNSEIKNLNEICTMRAGQHISASKILADIDIDHIYPCFGGNGIRGFVNKNSHDGSYLLVGRQGALCGNVHRMNGKFYATEHAVVVTAKEGINIDWAFHMLTLMNLNQYASKSAQPGLAVGKLASLKVSVPHLDEQERIASILDKFDTLTTSLTEGLPGEIALRQQQYEYYRELLLNFPKVEGNA